MKYKLTYFFCVIIIATAAFISHRAFSYYSMPLFAKMNLEALTQNEGIPVQKCFRPYCGNYSDFAVICKEKETTIMYECNEAEPYTWIHKDSTFFCFPKKKK